MDHHFTIDYFEEKEEENFLHESIHDPSMNRVLKRECHRGRKSKFNRKNRRTQAKSKSRLTSARKERFRQKICGNDVYYDDYIYASYNERAHCEQGYLEPAIQPNEWDDMNQILPAEELGIEEGSMYDRLMSILEGDDITPEDYDLLLQLDSNNARTTLDETEISQFHTFVIGDDNDVNVNEGVDSNGDDSHYKNLLQNSSRCDICLESWSDQPKGTEVRCLPCNHIFCKNCIDDWLSQRSHKCPNLSCYWSMEAEDD